MSFAGKGGYFLVDGNIAAEILEWSMSISKDMLDSTVLTAAGTEWRTFKDGLKEWSGSVSAFWDLTDTDGQKALHDALKNDTSVVGYFHISDSYYYWGTTTLEAEDVGMALEDMVDISFDMQGSGTISDNF